jgi:FkbM family methyltransferase
MTRQCSKGFSMTFVSYAQNFEDVLLWRALAHLKTGFYIDVGASHPDTDSVTRAFYDRGWHGINIEPTAASYTRLVAARPRDTTLCMALGSQPGTARFYAVEGAASGLSTLDADAAAQYAGMGFHSTETQVEVQTLAAVCRDHAPPAIHFLKIDVEGAERQVLEGADFHAFRPWIILLEATAPMSTREIHSEWEQILDQAEYRFLWFDGLNRFYAAVEHHETLATFFRTPPNVFDNFLRAADTEWARRIAQAEVRLEAVQSHLAAAERRTSVAEDRATAALLKLASQNAHHARLHAEIESLRPVQQRSAQLEAELSSAQLWLDAMRRSASWKITAPLRRIVGGRTRASAATSAATPILSAAAAAAPRRLTTRSAETVSTDRIRAVHQFHSGSAVGDAITNAMLLTRDVLRNLGFDSHIFVEHKDPACGQEIRTLDDLPGHNQYVLIVRHSMGHDALDRILALPVRKVLMYHNITPAALLSDSPFLASYSQKGRDQLVTLRGAVAAALADSEYNALELRAAGFRSPVACSLLIDVEAVAARAAPRCADTVFTILFVGRVTRSKGQLDLVEAYARFRALYSGDSRLVLVGRHDPDDPYVTEVLHAIHRHGLGNGPVNLTGLVSDDALRQFYAEADLYVSLSLHEGFGVPLMEAMAQGVPVLAYPAGAVPYTLGGAAAVLDDATPAGAAARMQELADDPQQRAAIVERQHTVVAGNRVGVQIPRLVAALREAGAAAPPDPVSHQAIADNIQATVCGHVNGTYSLAEVNRAFACALDRARPGSARLLPVEGEVTTDVSRVPDDQRDAIRALLARPPFASAPQVLISQHYPVWVPPERGDLDLALFFWEESLVPSETIDRLSKSFDGVLAPTATVAKALIDSGLRIPVRIIGHAPNLGPFRRLRQERADAPPSGRFCFLHVSSCFPRKGVDVLLAAYARAFRRTDPVRLVVKGFPNPHNDVAAQVARLQASDPDAPEIEFIDRDLPATGLHALYRSADAMVLPTRGEGYNLPAAEALAAGIPVIVTGAGGHMDFATDRPPGDVRLVKYSVAPAATHLSTPFSLWAEPDVDDLVSALREAFHRGRHVASEPQHLSCDLAARLGGIAADLILAPPRRPVAVAWVTTWGVPCGIAEYARHLIGRSTHDATILADLRSPTQAGEPGPPVQPAWQVADETSLPRLLGAIISADPNVVILQHQPGLMPWTMLATMLEASVLHGRVVCAVLHNTHNLLDVAHATRTHALHAMARISRVVVHTIADLNRLADMGLSANVTMIPQGAPALHPRKGAAPRVIGANAPVLIGCYGFFLPGKGVPELIEAFGLVRGLWPRARLRLVNAEYPLPESAEEVARCRALASAAGLDDAIEFVTGFLEHDDSEARLAECDLIVLPYQQSKEASSAALRTALVVGVPVAVTPLALFDEAEDAVLRLPGLSPAAIAEGIGGAIGCPATRAASVAAAHDWMARRCWPTIAQRWDGMIEALVTSLVFSHGNHATPHDAGWSDASHPFR